MAQTQNEARARRILDAAAELIVHYGYDKTTVSDIAERAGVSKGAIYLHWASKNELFEALIWRETWRYVDDWLKRVEEDPEGGTLFGMFKNGLIILNNSPFVKAFYTNDRRILGDFLRRQGSDLFRERFAMNHDFVRMMQEAGTLRQDVDPVVVAYLFNLVAYGFVTIDQVIPPENAPPLMSVITMMNEMLIRAFATENGRNSEAGKQIVKGLVEAFRKQQSPP
jgi:TetR/AcrR family acrAB operon transcriptional repressor